MRRSAHLTAPQALRKPVSVSARRSAAVENADGGAAVPRVRDSLVLRRVGKKKSAAKRSADARRAR
jgi:hypothetical protein